MTTLRSKFIAALVGMVIFMALIFAQISQISLQSYSKHTERYVQYGYAQQWERILTAYYIDRGSWVGLNGIINRIYTEPPGRLAPGRETEKLMVFDGNKKVISSAQPENIGKNLSDFFNTAQLGKSYFPIIVDGMTVGYFGLRDVIFDFSGAGPQDLEEKNLTGSLMRATLTALIITTILALLFGILVTRRLTGPLHDLTEAVKRAGKGDYSFRLKIKGKDDAALLGQAFNGMLDQIEQNEEVRRNMVADVAHELRTPLAIISGKLESIQQGAVPAVPENLLPIQDETIRLIRIVRDLQQLSLAEAGKLPLFLQKVDLKQLIAKILDQFTLEFEERGITAAIEGEAGEIECDPDRLTQVFINLIGNALHHTGQGGKIRIGFKRVERTSGEKNKEKKSTGSKKIKRDKKVFWNPLANRNKRHPDSPQWLQIKVEDTGEGIPEENLKHIFDRFYRSDKARNRESGGTGLGLAIAREFVQAHGGWMAAESTVGVGTTFYVYLRCR